MITVPNFFFVSPYSKSPINEKWMISKMMLDFFGEVIGCFLLFAANKQLFNETVRISAKKATCVALLVAPYTAICIIIFCTDGWMI